MKKFFLMLAVALPMFFMTACGDDEETTVSLDKSTLSLTLTNPVKNDSGKVIGYYAEGELKASEKNGDWASSDEFVATVDSKGKVTAHHSGVATITYIKDNASASCKVTVSATNNFFDTYTVFGASKSQVEAFCNNNSLAFLQEEDGDLMYTLSNKAYPWYGFFFTNGELDGSAVYFPDEMFDSQNFNEFILQNYKEYESITNGKSYIDANTATEASMKVDVTWDNNENVWKALYLPRTHTKAAQKDLATRADKLYKASVK